MQSNESFRGQLEKALEPVKISFHVPGHKYGQAMGRHHDPVESHFLLDTTELPGTDNLHEAEGLIKDAQERARNFYGSQETFFLVNGTTAGILAMILTVLEPGDTLLMGRDCHQSVYHGAYLAHAKIRWLIPEYDPKTLLNLGIGKESVEASLKAHPEIKAVVLTYPTYFGICSDLQGIAAVCQAHGVLLLVDEAHGAHFPLSSQLPKSALYAGADISVQSTHKSLPALTQSSMLHVGSHRIDRDKLRWMLRIVQTSSPSYLLMQSLDQAVAMAVRYGSQDMSRLLEELCGFRERVRGIHGLRVYGNELIGAGAVHAVDLTKVIVNPCALGLNGSDLTDYLRAAFGIQMELSTPWLSLGITSIGNRPEDIIALGAALEKAATNSNQGESKIPMGLLPPLAPQTILGWREALGAPRTVVSLSESLGATSGAMITPYPPGIPLLMPGERITREAIEYLQACRQSGISVMGLQGAQDQIQVVNT